MLSILKSDLKISSYILETNVTFVTYLNAFINETFVFANITPEIILDTVTILKPKNSSGKDNISTKLLKEIIDCIDYPIAHLFNLSFKTGYIPSGYKMIPIFKADEKDKFNNYRPISIFPVLSKLIEKIAAIQMFRYL